MGKVDQVVIVVVVNCMDLGIGFGLGLRDGYLFEVALGLFDGADEHGSGLDVFFALFLGYALADEDALAVGEDDTFEGVELLDHPLEEFGALSSH